VIVILPPPTPAPTPSGAPTLDPISNLTVIQGATGETINLTGITPGSSASKSPLHISAASSNPRLAPMPLVRYASPASNAVLSLRLMPADTGTATITVTINNGAKSNNIVRQSFTVTVVPPLPPTLDPVASVAVPANATLQTIQLTGITGGATNFNGTLRVTASSSNSRAFVPKIQYTSPGDTALLTFTPASRYVGTAIVTVTVSDGSKYNGTVHQRFTVTVAPVASSNTAKVAQVSAVQQTVPVADATALLTPMPSASGGFACQVTSTSGGTYVVQATSDLVHWTPVLTNTAPFTFQDTTVGIEKRFYRAYSAQ
jgi:hypothetical protein